ncbi:hypothetical protein [Paenibacillus sp. HB172176]|uniref:hypothetical protein n=1 Tax=Paenibacillus sp. HB172176 TaxID=2493690 RepID=UPI00143B8F8B|nr:hypothetical protein [Paenibacillus sp. HB172176]
MILKFRYALLSFLILTMMMMAACTSDSNPPKAALMNAIAKTMDADSYEMSFTMNIHELDIGNAADKEVAGGLTAASLTSMLKDATIEANAVYQKEPMRTDLDLQITLPSLLDMKLNVPMIMTQDMLYVKLTNIPLLQLPEEMADQYVRIDLNELSQEQGGEKAMDLQKDQRMLQDSLKTLLDGFDEKTYFSTVKTADAELPQDLKVNQVISFSIKEDNYGQSVETLVNTVLPELLDILLANKDNLAAFNMDTAKLEQTKADWETNRDAMSDKLLNHLTLDTMNFTGAIRDDYLVYESGELAMQADDTISGGEMKLSFSFSGQYSKLDEAVIFKEELPADTVALDELTALLKAPATTE